ncbi:glycerate kinase [Planococcus sp. X10-3]|uniref:glycerate kinase n=1 Tax=Planococcus sp. X10-3 TaxID=3061240 RepID=UPI003BAF90D0
MKIVIAPDSFKGSLTSVEASRIINEAIWNFDPSINTVQIPMADGGEGTVDAVLWNRGGERISCLALDPLGRKMTAQYGWLDEDRTAIIETAAASGLPLLSDAELDPERASSFGTGQLIKDALDRGAEKIILGLGGSATIDAGTGLFQALGVKFVDDKQEELLWIGGQLDRIAAIDVSGLDQRLEAVQITIASDVSNPLLGNDGAVAVFGPQKGLAANQIENFERGMRSFADITTRQTGTAFAGEPGSGAAGGIGYLLRTLLNVEFRSGLEMISEAAGLAKQLEDADLVLTGEGKIDGQSLFGKVPVGIGRLAKETAVPVIAFAGSIGPGTEQLEHEGVAAIMPISDSPMSLSDAMLNSEKLLYNATTRLMKIIQIGKNM